MKFLFNLIPLLFILGSFSTESDANQESRNGLLRGSENRQTTHPVFMIQPCTLLGAKTEYENGHHEFSWHCEMDSIDADGEKGIILPLEGLDLPETAVDRNGNRLVNGESTLFVPGMEIRNNNNNAASIRIPPGLSPEFGWHTVSNGHRMLAVTEGIKRVLVVRITGSDATTSSSRSDLSDSVFGTSGDHVNLKSQFEACSYNKIKVEPGITPSEAVLDVADGVVEIAIASTISGADSGTISNFVTVALSSNGFNLPGNYDHVMYCLPPGTSGGWIAYAYVNHWKSVYNDQWCTYVSSQMHEIGHNMNLAHAGEGTAEYADESGMMGYSYRQDDGPLMCFNGPENWQLGWYNDRHTTVNPFSLNWSGDLVGISDYANSVGRTIILKINTSSSDDYYVIFNRKSGINAGTKEGGDQVLVTRQGGEGESYSKSTLLAKLIVGESYYIDNFDNSDETIVITVNSITTATSPPKANVAVFRLYTPPVASPTQTPTTSPPTLPPSTLPPAPTPSPTKSPTMPPSTLPPSTLPPTPTPSPTQAPTSSSPTLPPSTLPPSPVPIPTQTPMISPPTSLPTTLPPNNVCINLQTIVLYIHQNGRSKYGSCARFNKNFCQLSLPQGGFVFEICQATCSQFSEVTRLSNWIDCVSP